MITLDTADIANSLYRLARLYPGQSLATQMNGEASIILQNPADIQRVLRDNAGAYQKYMQWFRQIIGPSRFSEDGPEWERRYALSHQHFTEFDRARVFQTAQAAAERLGAELASSGLARVTMTPLRAAMADTLCRYFLDQRLAALDLDLDALSDLVEIATHFAILPPQIDERAERRRLSELRRRTLSQLSRLRQLEAPAGSFLAGIKHADAARPDPVYFEHEMLIFFAAGSDASGAAIGWALLALADNPKLSARLYGELGGIDWRAASAVDLVLGCRALRNFLSEVLRLFPPFPMIGRVAMAEDELSCGKVAPGQKLVVSLVGAMVQEDPADLIRDEQFAMAPQGRGFAGTTGAFSMGPRICGGKMFAIVELMAAIGRLISLYHIERTASEAYDYKWKAQLIHGGGYPVRFVPRA